MSQRPGVQVTVTRETDGGESPNRYIPAVSAHVRAYWPAHTSLQEVQAVFDDACNLAWDKIIQRHEETYHDAH